MKKKRIHALRVLRLVRLVERCERDRTIAVTPKMLRLMFPKLTGVSNRRWEEAEEALKKVSRVPSLEGRYRQCGKIYLRLMGDIREIPEIQADVNCWEPICRGQADAQSMRALIKQMNGNAVVTGTIHSAKGGEWDHVLIVGATDGLLPIYLSLSDKEALGEERNLLYVAITRARETVRLYHSPTAHALSRQRFEDISRFLDDDAVRKTLSAVRIQAEHISSNRNH